jgi:hypothetical protein
MRWAGGILPALSVFKTKFKRTQMIFTARKTIASKLDEYEGVSFTLNKMTEGRRVKLRVDMAPHSHRLRELIAEATRMEESDNAAGATQILEEVRVITEDHIPSEFLRWGLHAIKGLQVKEDEDSEPVEVTTADALIAIGPRPLFDEIVLAIRAEAGVSEEKLGESAPPTISDAQVGGEKSTSSAGTAESKATT